MHACCRLGQVYPGAPGFLEYLDSCGHYSTRLLEAAYEYEQARAVLRSGRRTALSALRCSCCALQVLQAVCELSTLSAERLTGACVQSVAGMEPRLGAQ